MKMYRLFKLSMFVVLLTSGQAYASTEELNEFQKTAVKVLSAENQIAGYDSVLNIFESVMHEETRITFAAYFSIIYNKNFPKAPHPPAKILEFFRCLYAALAESYLLEPHEESVTQQREELNKRLYFHKAAIAKFNQQLADQIQGFPCENCVKSAKLEIMGWSAKDKCME